MRTKYSKLKKSNEKLVVKTLPPISTSNEGEIANNQNKSLAAPHNNAYSDEEWLLAKNRLLDSRIESQNLMKTTYKSITHLPTI